jgi:hypothetical protein
MPQIDLSALTPVPEGADAHRQHGRISEGTLMGLSAAIAMLIAMSLASAPVPAQQAPMSPIYRSAASASERAPVSNVVTASPAPAITMPVPEVAGPIATIPPSQQP